MTSGCLILPMMIRVEHVHVSDGRQAVIGNLKNKSST